MDETLKLIRQREAEGIAKQLRQGNKDKKLIIRLCELAGKGKELSEAGEYYESIVQSAADFFGVRI